MQTEQTKYMVSWGIVVAADNPEKAALTAFAIQKSASSPFFQVIDMGTMETTVVNLKAEK